jgi:hypothetical protein
MFIRKKKNRSGTTSVVVVDKHGDKFKELHTVGIAYASDEIDKLCAQGNQWIKDHIGQLTLDFEEHDQKVAELAAVELMLGNIDSILLNGAKLIIDKVYNNIGFDQISDEVLRYLVTARLCQPMSKMAMLII